MRCETTDLAFAVVGANNGPSDEQRTALHHAAAWRAGWGTDPDHPMFERLLGAGLLQAYLASRLGGGPTRATVMLVSGRVAAWARRFRNARRGSGQRWRGSCVQAVGTRIHEAIHLLGIHPEKSGAAAVGGQLSLGDPAA